MFRIVGKLSGTSKQKTPKIASNASIGPAMFSQRTTTGGTNRRPASARGEE
jgi:hypothetical protein